MSKTGFDSTLFASQKGAIEAQILQEKKSRFMSDWMAKIKEDADIEDNRDTFFR